jgi:sec-independent protein translocase protein TatA
MFPNIGHMELLVILGLGVLLFGKRLPEVGRSLGRGIVEFKKGLNGLGEEMDITSSLTKPSSNYGGSHYGGSSHYHGDSSHASSSTTYSENTVPKFELPGAASTAPTPHMEYQGPQTQD